MQFKLFLKSFWVEIVLVISELVEVIDTKREFVDINLLIIYKILVIFYYLLLDLVDIRVVIHNTISFLTQRLLTILFLILALLIV